MEAEDNGENIILKCKVLDMFVEISWQKVGSIDGILWTRL
jgi:hypothetical protein